MNAKQPQPTPNDPKPDAPPPPPPKKWGPYPVRDVVTLPRPDCEDLVATAKRSERAEEALAKIKEWRQLTRSKGLRVDFYWMLDEALQAYEEGSK